MNKRKLLLLIILVAVSSSISTAFAVGSSNIIFKTFDGIASHEVMRITSDQKVGIGTTAPAAKLDVNGDVKGSNNILWSSGKSVLSADQGGSISLGNGLTPGATPYLDFYYGNGISNKFNMRLINNANGLLSLYGGILSVNDSVYVGAKSNPSPGANSLYVKNDQGDGFDTLRVDGSGNNLYLIAKSDPGAVAGAGIVFRTAPTGGGELDRMTIDPAGNININSGGKLVCVGCIDAPELKSGIQVIDCTKLVPGAPLIGCNLSNMDLHGMQLSNVNLAGANLTNANLSGANLTKANLSDVNLYGANLSGTNFTWANLSGANLFAEDISNTNLYLANLTGAFLLNANISTANLISTNLSGANLFGATNQPTGNVLCFGTPIHADFTCNG